MPLENLCPLSTSLSFLLHFQLLAWCPPWGICFFTSLPLEPNDCLCFKTLITLPRKGTLHSGSFEVRVAENSQQPTASVPYCQKIPLYVPQVSLLGAEGHFLHSWFCWDSFRVTSFLVWLPSLGHISVLN